MNKAEATAGGIVTVVGILMLLESMKFAYFLDGVPGPGFLPRWVAAGLVCVGLFLTAKGIRPGMAAQKAIEWPDAGACRRVAAVLGTLAITLLLLEKLGFVIVVAVFMAVVMYSLSVRSWLMLAAVPVLTAIGLYVVFAVWLLVPLPRGVLVLFD